MLDSYGEKIVNSLFQYTMDPSRPCAAVGLCKNRDNKPLVLSIPEDVMVESITKKNYVKFTPEHVQVSLCFSSSHKNAFINLCAEMTYKLKTCSF